MKIRTFRTRERASTPVWEVTPTGLRQVTVDVDQNTAENATLDDVVAGLDAGLDQRAINSTHIVHYSVAAAMENGNAFLYHSFLLRE